MPSFHVLTDSNCLLPASLCGEMDIHVVPLPYVWEGQTYLDGESFPPREFYRKLRASKKVPKTSAPTPGVLIETMRSLLADGKPILGIFVGADFSSTLMTAQLAAKEIGDPDITLLDSETNGLALGFQALAAARLARDGGGVDEAVELVGRVRENSGLVFAVPDLDHLRRGGRIGLAQSLLGSALNMVPILEIQRGPITPVEQVRTKGRAMRALVSLVEARLGGSRPYRIGVLHSDAESLAWELQQAVKDRLGPDELFMLELNSILAIHVGPDAFGLAYSSGV
jgi:DegV family protein with EDD domain